MAQVMIQLLEQQCDRCGEGYLHNIQNHVVKCDSCHAVQARCPQCGELVKPDDGYSFCPDCEIMFCHKHGEMRLLPGWGIRHGIRQKMYECQCGLEVWE